jgi:hypothetical protein
MGGRSLKRGKKLTPEEKRFLNSQGLNPNNFLFTRKMADFYEFYKIDTAKLITIRR